MIKPGDVEIRKWISPDGRVHPVGDKTGGHVGFAEKRLGMPGAGVGASEVLLSQGWVRVSTFEVEGRAGPLEVQWPKIRRMLLSLEDSLSTFPLWIVVSSADGRPEEGLNLVVLPERLDLSEIRDSEMIRFEQSRDKSQHVRSHLRRRVLAHLKNPPKSCFCHRSKAVDKIRRGLIRRLE